MFLPQKSPFYLLSTLSCIVVLTSLIHPALPINYIAQFDYLCTCPEYILNAMCRLLKILYRNVEVCCALCLSFLFSCSDRHWYMLDMMVIDDSGSRIVLMVLRDEATETRVTVMK